MAYWWCCQNVSLPISYPPWTFLHPSISPFHIADEDSSSYLCLHILTQKGNTSHTNNTIMNCQPINSISLDDDYQIVQLDCQSQQIASILFPCFSSIIPCFSSTLSMLLQYSFHASPVLFPCFSSTIGIDAISLRIALVVNQCIGVVNQIYFIGEQMCVHRQVLSFDLGSPRRSTTPTRQLETVIKSTLDHQIHQHVKAVPSLEHTLIARTKRILSNGESPAVGVGLGVTVGGSVGVGVGGRVEQKERDQGRSGGVGRSRREWRVSQTKRQLELLNQLYRSINKNKVKRYCEEIQHQEAELHIALARNQLRKTINTPSLKCRPSPPSPPRDIQTSLPLNQRATKLKTQKQRELEMLFERLSPYRRLQITRLKAKDMLQPWQVNNLP